MHAHPRRAGTVHSGDALAEVRAILRAAPPGVPLLVHSMDAAAWPVLRWALDRGLDTRVGLEDTLVMPDDMRAPDNVALVAAAFAHLVERR